MNSIGVFCASRIDIDSSFIDAAKQLGNWIGSEGKTLVYGGSRNGLMEVLAKAVKEAGGRVFGVVPVILEARNLVSDYIDIDFRCENLSDRKEVMMREADILVALPGGIGTLDEVFTTLAANMIGYTRKKVVLLNINGFWKPALAMIAEMQKQGLVATDLSDALLVANSVEELSEMCK